MEGEAAPATVQMVGMQVLNRLQTRLEQAVQRQPLDIDYIGFICASSMALMSSVSAHVNFPHEVCDELHRLVTFLSNEMDRNRRAITITRAFSGQGRPKLSISEDYLQDLIEMDLAVPCISKIIGVSLRTIRRRMRALNLTVRESYSTMTDEELDRLILEIKRESSNLGHRMVKGRLRALGHRVQWTRVWDSMHRVDSAGILERMTSLGCVARRSYSVPGPLSLVHIDTNHKLIRYGMVIFGGIDGYSRKILYLRVANNNKASTALQFFLEGTENHGFPSRVRADQGVENVDIARCMFEVRGCGRGSFISGKSVHNQRIERLWRDVWNAVSNIYYDLFHNLEAERLLNPTDCTHLFCAQYVFLPRIQEDLNTFVDGWNNHSLRTEQNCTPNQLWEIGKAQSPIIPPENRWVSPVTDTDFDLGHTGIKIPDLVSPLDENQLQVMGSLFNPIAPSSSFGADIYCAVVEHVESV